MASVTITPKTTHRVLANLGEKLLGKTMVDDFVFRIGNYWDERRGGLNTEVLFKEMLRIFRKKKVVKELMKESREEAIKRMVNQDVYNIFNLWQSKVMRLIVRDVNHIPLDQVLTCEKSGLLFEEDSTCEVLFKNDRFESLVEGRRAIIGKCSSLYNRQYTDDRGVFHNEDVTRRLSVYNNFTRKTFWRTTGKTHTIVKDLLNPDGKKRKANRRELFDK
jgi:hypothetical protein